jgi:hypothetical protein
MAVLQYSSLINTVATTTNSGGTTTLINTSATIQVFSGTANQTVVLPDATTFSRAGISYQIFNLSSGSLQVNHNGGSALQTVPANSTLTTNLINNGTSAGVWTTLSNSTFPSLNAPTIQVFLSGSGTYTLPVGPTPLYLEVEMCGGGGGGGAYNGTGTTGGNTTFGTSFLTANGGLGGVLEAVGGAGGTVSIASSSGLVTLDSYAGGQGQPTSAQTSSFASAGGAGGANPFGGGGGGGYNNSNGNAAIVNSGGGGGGAGGGTATAGSSGGGAGGFIRVFISGTALASIMSSGAAYVVGAGGAGFTGTLGGNGGQGGSGIIIVKEFYQ